MCHDRRAEMENFDQHHQAFVDALCRLPDPYLEQVLDDSRRKLREEMITEIGDALQFCSDPKTAQRIQNHLFAQFILKHP